MTTCDESVEGKETIWELVQGAVYEGARLVLRSEKLVAILSRLGQRLSWLGRTLALVAVFAPTGGLVVLGVWLPPPIQATVALAALNFVATPPLLVAVCLVVTRSRTSAAETSMNASLDGARRKACAAIVIAGLALAGSGIAIAVAFYSAGIHQPEAGKMPTPGQQHSTNPAEGTPEGVGRADDPGQSDGSTPENTATEVPAASATPFDDQGTCVTVGVPRNSIPDGMDAYAIALGTSGQTVQFLGSLQGEPGKLDRTMEVCGAQLSGGECGYHVEVFFSDPGFKRVQSVALLSVGSSASQCQAVDATPSPSTKATSTPGQAAATPLGIPEPSPAGESTAVP